MEGQNMSWDEFFDKWNNRYCEFSGGGDALNQCIDVVNRGIVDVLGQQPFLYMNAKDVYDNADPNIYEKIENTPDAVPQRGDVIVWDAWEYGHIAIAEGTGDTGWFRSFDQNFPLGSNCHFVDHDYYGVRGFLRLKKGEEVTTEQAKQYVYKATRGHESDGDEWNWARNVNMEDLCSTRFRDDVIGPIWIATLNYDCPASEKDYWQNVARNSGNKFHGNDLAHQWYKDHVLPEIKNRDNEIQRLLKLPPKEVIKEVPVEKIVYVNTPLEKLTNGEIFKAAWDRIKKLFSKDKDEKKTQ